MLNKVKPAGRNKWRCQCPAHGASRDAMMFDLKPDGYILSFCFAGCTRQEILGAMGIQEKDLFTRNDDDWDKGEYEIKRITKELEFEYLIVDINNAHRKRFNGSPASKEDVLRYLLAKKRIRIGEKRMRYLKCHRR